jgi:hypothetical protein
MRGSQKRTSDLFDGGLEERMKVTARRMAAPLSVCLILVEEGSAEAHAVSLVAPESACS